MLEQQVREIQESNEDWGITSNNVSQEVSPEEARIKTLKDKKTELLLKYTDKHPEIVGIDKLIGDLQEQIEKNRKTTPISDDSEYIGAEKLSNPYVQTLKSAYDNAVAEVASITALVDSVNSRINALEEGLKDRLTIETEMKNLNRDYETINKQYSGLLERREQAHITEKVDDQTSRLKFKIADPPNKPTKPTFPNRILFYSLILVLGLIIGFGAALFTYYTRPVYMSTRQVRAITGLPSLGSVSLTFKGQASDKGRDWVLLLSIAVLLTGYAGIMTIELLK